MARSEARKCQTNNILRQHPELTFGRGFGMVLVQRLRLSLRLWSWVRATDNFREAKTS